MLMPSDVDIAALCAAIYAYPELPPETWDHYDAGLDDGICWALKHRDGYDVIVFRGSTTFQDWIRDFRAIAISTRIGDVHAGFYAGMEHAWGDIRPLLKQPAIVTGHSLGAGRAGIMTGLMKADGVVPVARVVFGEPRPGLRDFSNFIEEIPGRSYRNGDTHGGPFDHDLVTDVPLPINLLNVEVLPYEHPTPPIEVFAEPSAAGFKAWGIFAWHHIELYLAALKAPPVFRPLVPIST